MSSNRRKDVLTWVVVVGVLLLVGGAGFFVLWPQIQPHATVRLGDGVFSATVAKSDEERASSEASSGDLKDNKARLFAFTHYDKWPVRIKNLTTPVDIVWLDKDKKVVYIVKNAPPDSGEDGQFVPKKEAIYAIELPGGMVESKSIDIGDQATFDENNLEGVKF